MEIFYIGTGIFTAVISLFVLAGCVFDTVPYPIFFTGIGCVFWTFFAIAKLQ